MSPHEHTAQRVAEIWELLLGHGSFDRDQPFFEVGGDSRLAVELTLIIAEEFKSDVTTSDIFKYPTVHALAGFLHGLTGQPAPAEPRPSLTIAEPSAAAAHEDPAPFARETDVAVVGMAGRFPGARDVRQFWANLVAGTEMVGPLTAGRRELYARYYDLHPGTPRVDTAFGGWLDGLEEFDAAFFNISFRDAAIMDPAHRLMLEVAWDALADAGYADAGRRPASTSVFIGATAGEYARLNPAGPVVNGYEPSLLANRISYLLDARGPSIVVDTACSSSLVALHQACQSLIRGESDLALAGGVNLLLTPERYFTLGAKEVLSATGHCRPFDDGADGFVPSEGAAAVVLKPLRRAVEDNDTVLAVVRGSAVNHNGRTNGINSPNPAAQTEVILTAWDRAGLDPADLSYIEAHGTGTRLGDPIEVQGLTGAFDRYGGREEACAIGSIKSNVGHLEWASGLAGLIKCILALQNQCIPANLNFERLNSGIAAGGACLEVVASPRPWTAGDGRRTFAVSSFGLGGVNAHAVFEEPPPEPPGRAEAAGPRLLVLSARTPDALREMAARALERLNGSAGWTVSQVCRTLGSGRGVFAHRVACVVETESELLGELKRIAAGRGAG